MSCARANARSLTRFLTAACSITHISQRAAETPRDHALPHRPSVCLHLLVRGSRSYTHNATPRKSAGRGQREGWRSRASARTPRCCEPRGERRIGDRSQRLGLVSKMVGLLILTVVRELSHVLRDGDGTREALDRQQHLALNVALLARRTSSNTAHSQESVRCRAISTRYHAMPTRYHAISCDTMTPTRCRRECVTAQLRAVAGSDATAAAGGGGQQRASAAHRVWGRVLRAQRIPAGVDLLCRERLNGNLDTS